MASTPEIYGRIAEKYMEDYSREKNPERFKEFFELREKFAEKIEKGDRVLDAGCHAGMDSEFFVSNGFQYTGVDLSEKAIDLARDRKPGDYDVMDIKNLDFEDKSFEAVWSSAAIFFDSRDSVKTILNEFSRVLKSEGYVFVSTKVSENSEQGLKELGGEEVQEYYLSEEGFLEIFGREFEILEKNRNQRGRTSDFLAVIGRKVNNG